MRRILGSDIEQVRTGWQGMALLGVASIILGTLAIAVSFAATVATVLLLGCLFVAGGAVHLVQAFGTEGWGGLFGHILAAVLYCVAGIYMVMHPAVSAAPLTIVIGMMLAIGGLYQVITSVIMQYHSWGWACFQGAVSLALSVLIFRQWPVSAFWLIGTFVGVDLIFRGWSTLMLSMAIRAVAGQAEREGLLHANRRSGPGDRRLVAAA